MAIRNNTSKESKRSEEVAKGSKGSSDKCRRTVCNNYCGVGEGLDRWRLATPCRNQLNVGCLNNKAVLYLSPVVGKPQ